MPRHDGQLHDITGALGLDSDWLCERRRQASQNFLRQRRFFPCGLEVQNKRWSRRLVDLHWWHEMFCPRLGRSTHVTG